MFSGDRERCIGNEWVKQFTFFTGLKRAFDICKSSNLGCFTEKAVLKNIKTFIGKRLLEALLNKVAGHRKLPLATSAVSNLLT